MDNELLIIPDSDIVNRLPMDQHPAAVYLATLQPTGERAARHALDLAAGILTGGRADSLTIPWPAIRFQHTAAIRAQMVQRYSPATVNLTLSAVRGVLKAAWQLGQMSAADYQLAVSVKSVKGSTIPAGRELSAGELSALMTACDSDTTHAGIRDAAIIALMYSCGLRREEVITLTMEDYDPETGRLVVRGKGKKERTTYLANGALYALGDWLKARGTEAGPLFYAINKSGRINNQRAMTPQAVYNLLAKRAEQAGVNSFSPHDLRRTFVSDMLDAGADIATVAKIAGHANINTTTRYDRRPEEAKKKAAGLLHIPYTKRKFDE